MHPRVTRALAVPFGRDSAEDFSPLRSYYKQTPKGKVLDIADWSVKQKNVYIPYSQLKVQQDFTHNSEGYYVNRVASNS